MVLEILIDVSGILIPFAVIIYYYKLKTHAIDKICDHPELSDDKVKNIAKMVSKHLRLK